VTPLHCIQKSALLFLLRMVGYVRRAPSPSEVLQLRAALLECGPVLMQLCRTSCRLLAAEAIGCLGALISDLDDAAALSVDVHASVSGHTFPQWTAAGVASRQSQRAFAPQLHTVDASQPVMYVHCRLLTAVAQALEVLSPVGTHATAVAVANAATRSDNARVACATLIELQRCVQ
jgi:hypothetical protein